MVVLHCLLALISQGVLASPHEDFQARASTHRTHQAYAGPSLHRRLQESQTCEQVHAAGSWGRIRIGYEFMNQGSVASDLLALTDTLMAKAVAFWSSALEVRRAQQPLRMDRSGTGCFKYAFDTEWRCATVQSRMCGAVTVPDQYLNRMRACQQTCVPSMSCGGACASGGSCACDVDEWRAQGESYCCSMSPDGCPEGCSLATATKVGNGTTGSFVCEDQCTEAAEGAGAENEDLHIFVTVEDTSDCQGSSSLLAYALSCAVDQCDRPVFGMINFCPGKLGGQVSETELTSTAVHELAHVLAFSSSHFRNFRNADGSPMIPRQPQDETRHVGEVFYSCSSSGYNWNVSYGTRKYVDISPTIVDVFSERGYDQCECPIGTTSISSGCFLPTEGFQTPSCVVRMTTPAVLAEVRDFFACPGLAGAELENQQGDGCSIIASHWESRAFAGELMSPTSVEHLVGTYLSRVTLAVFVDSGWYRANMSAADPLVKGVHWGYQQGCGFATSKCMDQNVPAAEVFCSDVNSRTCSLDREAVVGCEISTAYSSVPPVYAYMDSKQLGVRPDMDYCPHYAVQIGGRVCTNASSVTVPYSNVNFMREHFSSGSRCFLSTLYTNVPAEGGGTYTAPADQFTSARPVCYEVACSGQSYDLKVSDLNGGSQVIGTCTTEGQTLTIGGGGGSVTCAAPAQVCSDLGALHVLGDQWAGQGGGTTSSPGAGTSTSTVGGGASTSQPASTTDAGTTADPGTTANGGTTTAGGTTAGGTTSSTGGTTTGSVGTTPTLTTQADTEVVGSATSAGFLAVLSAALAASL
ncbi:unnamed protein product [Effrenium voratum]|nr:unnamed protein product [Effrenium voratum]